MNEVKTYSVHAFMLPLRWDYLPEGYTATEGKSKYSFDERTNLREINKLLLASGWKRSFYRINGLAENYNELTYFHAYASKTIFDLQQASEKTEEIVDEKKVMTYYEIEPAENENAFYRITTKEKTYELKLTGISLHVYNTGVAIITYNLSNNNYTQPEDILRINEFGRRIYPQFLTDDTQATEAAKNTFHPQKIEMLCSGINGGHIITEDFSHYDDIASLETHSVKLEEYCFGTIVKLPAHITALFNKSFVFGANVEKQDKIRFNLLADDRMFFQCWYGNDKLADTFTKDEEILKKTDEIRHLYRNSPFWYGFVFGDRGTGNLGIGNSLMMEEEIKRCTYKRWADFGTLYGFTRDSFVAVSSSIPTLLQNKVPDLSRHMKTMYYQMAVLCLVQRATILRFSAEVSELADLGKKDTSRTIDQIKDLYLNYIEFINKIYFREITSHIQGIEMYVQYQQIMNIASDVTDLDREIDELHNFAMMQKQDEQTRQGNRLTQIATLFLPASLVFSIIGANIFDKENTVFGGSNIDWNSIYWIITGFVPSLLLFAYLKFRKKSKN